MADLVANTVSIDSTAPSLDVLQELPFPPVVPYIPQTIGWVILAALVIVLICWSLWRNYQYRLANRYRVDALAELDQIEQTLDSQPTAATRVPTLIKRVALTAAPRADIAALSGDAWLQWLDASLPQAGFLDAPGKLIPALAYGSTNVESPTFNTQDLRALLALTRRWIREHHVRV